MSNTTDSLRNIVFVTAGVCLLCALFVSSASIALRDKQIENAKLEQQRNVLSVLGITSKNAQTVREQFATLYAQVVDLQTGEYANNITASEANVKAQLRNSEQFIQLTHTQDIAGIKKREQYATVYLLRKDGELHKIVLPIRGYGLWSTLYGYIALEKDLNTIAGVSFYQHAETPGLGGEVDNQKWKQQWVGKHIYNKQEQVAFRLVKGGVIGVDAYGVDALSGASLTSRGVESLIQFWFGNDGFGPFLQHLKQIS